MKIRKSGRRIRTITKTKLIWDHDVLNGDAGVKIRIRRNVQGKHTAIGVVERGEAPDRVDTKHVIAIMSRH